MEEVKDPLPNELLGPLIEYNAACQELEVAQIVEKGDDTKERIRANYTLQVVQKIQKEVGYYVL